MKKIFYFFILFLVLALIIFVVYIPNRGKDMEPDETPIQKEYLDISSLKIEGTVALAISDSYPFKKGNLWNTTKINLEDDLIVYVFIGNYQDISHNFIIYWQSDYKQIPSILENKKSILHNISLKPDEHILLKMKIKFEKGGEHVLQLVNIWDPFKMEQMKNSKLIPSAYYQFSPRIKILVKGGDKNG